MFKPARVLTLSYWPQGLVSSLTLWLPSQVFHERAYSRPETTEQFHREITEALSVKASDWDKDGTRTVKYDLPLMAIPSAVKRVLGG